MAPTPIRRSGLTLLESALLVGLVGIALAVFIPTFSRELETSKLAEPARLLDALAGKLVTYHARRVGTHGSCLPNAAGPVPNMPRLSAIAGDFDGADPKVAGFQAIGFAPKTPIRFRYTMLPERSGCDVPAGTTVTLRAEGDLDADGTFSTFERVLTSNGRGALRSSSVLEIKRRTE